MGALCYLAAWDVGRAKIFDRCAPKDGIEPFDALIDQVMSQHPYQKAQRVFLVIDNGSAHRGARSTVSKVPGPTWSRFTPPFMPRGSVRPRSTFPSSNARSSPRTTLPTLTPSRSVCWFSDGATKQSRCPSNGSSPARIFARYWPRPTPPLP